MRNLIGKTVSHPILSLGSTVLWGLLELIALQWSRLGDPALRAARRAR